MRIVLINYISFTFYFQNKFLQCINIFLTNDLGDEPFLIIFNVINTFSRKIHFFVYF